jgi:hypothetical protein
MACCVPSGSEAYAALYPETSSDNVLRLGNVVPDFEAETTVGPHCIEVCVWPGVHECSRYRCWHEEAGIMGHDATGIALFQSCSSVNSSEACSACQCQSWSGQPIDFNTPTP